MARLSIRPLHLAVLALLPLLSSSLSLGTGGLRDWQRLRARETADALDASRYHLQILFVDEGDGKGRIAEGLLARVGEWNDAVNILFPSSTSVCDPSKPVDVRPQRRGGGGVRFPRALRVAEQGGGVVLRHELSGEL